MQATERWQLHERDRDNRAYQNGDCSPSAESTRGFHTYTMTGDAIIWTSTTPARSPVGLRSAALSDNVEPPANHGSHPNQSSVPAELSQRAASMINNVVNVEVDNRVGMSDVAREYGTTTDIAKPDRYSEKVFLHGFIRLDELDASDIASRNVRTPNNADLVPESTCRAPLSEAALTEDVEAVGSADVGQGGGPSYAVPRTNVDISSAQRLAKRLYQLDGFKRSDVMKHLGKNNEFSRVVSEEYFKFFDFLNMSLVTAMRVFLKLHTLQGETYERERVLSQFSHRYVMCNPHMLSASSTSPTLASQDVFFQSEDACHTLTCAVMLLNTDLHAQNIGKKMTQQEFLDNLEGLNDGKDYPKDFLKSVYQEIRDEPLSWPGDDVCTESVLPQQSQDLNRMNADRAATLVPTLTLSTENCFLIPPDSSDAVEYKRGPLKRKCCIGSGAVRVPLGKRSWKSLFTVLKGATLYFAKDEASAANGFAGLPFVRLYHALASVATDYKKKKHVMRLQTADQSSYLFQASDKETLEDWITTINLVAASTSAPELPAPVGSQSKFRRPLLPSGLTTLNLRDQLKAHRSKLQQILQSIGEHEADALSSKGVSRSQAEAYADKEHYLQYEARRYKVYAELLLKKLEDFPELEPTLATVAIGEGNEPPSSPTQRQNAATLAAAISWDSPSRTATDRGDLMEHPIGGSNVSCTVGPCLPP